MRYCIEFNSREMWENEKGDKLVSVRTYQMTDDKRQGRKCWVEFV